MNIKVDIAAATAIPSRHDTILADGMRALDGPFYEAITMLAIADELYDDTFGRHKNANDAEWLEFKIHRSEWERMCFAIKHARGLVQRAFKIYDAALNQSNGVA